jgi:tRNA (Thr-GGU) A37 N-methylase
MGSPVTCNKPYKNAPDVFGFFATRSDYRPNPIGLSVFPVKSIDIKKGIVGVYYLDAEDGSPVIDIKPYHLAVDRVRNVATPSWCSHGRNGMKTREISTGRMNSISR